MSQEELAMETERKEMTAVERAREYGIDISLLESWLALTPTERLIRNEGMLALAREFARARAQQDVAHRGTAETAPRE